MFAAAKEGQEEAQGSGTPEPEGEECTSSAAAAAAGYASTDDDPAEPVLQRHPLLGQAQLFMQYQRHEQQRQGPRAMAGSGRSGIQQRGQQLVAAPAREAEPAAAAAAPAPADEEPEPAPVAGIAAPTAAAPAVVAERRRLLDDVHPIVQAALESFPGRKGTLHDVQRAIQDSPQLHSRLGALLQERGIIQ